MQARVKPRCSVAVDPAGTMADTGIEAVLDLGYVGPGESGDSHVEIGEEALTMMRHGDEIIFRTVQNQRFASALVQRIEDGSLVRQKAERLVRPSLAHYLAAGIPRAAVAIEVA